jgi:hypothetical protein
VLVAGAVWGFAHLWEWRQPKLELQAVRVASIVPYDRLGGELRWPSGGVHVRFEGQEGVVDFPAARWDQSVAVGDTIDAVIRSSFFGVEYDGLEISGSPFEPSEPEPPH